MAFSTIGTVLGVGSTISSYKKRRAERPEESGTKAFLTSAVGGVAKVAMWGMAPKLMMVKEVAGLAGSAGSFIASTHVRGANYKRYNPQFGGNFMDTEMTATMRQRGVQAMHNSRMNARSVLGNEARSLHNTRPW